MDQSSRQRMRAIRTIGRLSMPPADDVLLAQWPLPADTEHQRQDVAISSEWKSGRRSRSSPSQSMNVQRDTSQLELLLAEYEAHQRLVIERLLEVLEAELEGSDSLSLAYEPPAVTIEAVRGEIERLVSQLLLSTESAAAMANRAGKLGESVARLWAMIDLYRSGHISREELVTKRDQVLEEIADSPQPRRKN